MSLSDEDRATMVRLEIEKSRKTFEETSFLVKANLLNGAASRLYYEASKEDLQELMSPAQEMIETVAEMVKKQ